MKNLSKQILYTVSAILILSSFTKDKSSFENYLTPKISTEITVNQQLKYELAVKNFNLINNSTTVKSDHAAFREKSKASKDVILTNRKAAIKERSFQGSFYKVYALH